MSQTAGAPLLRDVDDPVYVSRKYQYPIYFVTGITLLFGIITCAVAAKTLKSNDGSSIAIPSWALNGAAAFGAIVVIISLLGMFGARSAPDHIENRTRNWPLTIFFVVVAIGLIMQFSIAGTVLTQLDVINNAKAQTYAQGTVNTFDADVLSFTTEQAAKWVDIQNGLGCCGYNSTTDATATGAQCCVASPPVSTPNCATVGAGYGPAANIQTCRAQILTSAASSIKTIGALAVVLGLFQLACFFSAFCLLCCVKRSE